MADEEVPSDMALMAFSDFEVHNDKTCSKTYLKSFKTLKTQLDDLRIEFNKYEFNLATYKRGLASVEEQLVFYKKNEVLFYEQLAVLKRDISYKDSEISVLKSELEKLKQDKESNQLKIENFDNASKSLDKLIGSQIPDKSRKGLGFVSYNAVLLPPTGLFSPPTIDLSNFGLEEKSPDAPLVEELVSDVDKFEKKTVFPTKIEFVKQQEKPVRKPVKYAEMYRSQGPRGNQRNWNNQKSQQLGSDFVMYNKACFCVEVLTICRRTTITIKGKGWLMLLRPQHVGFRDLPNLTVHQLLLRDNFPNKELNKGGTDLSHMLNKVLFEATVKRVNTFTPMKSDDTVPKVIAGSSKRSAKEELGEESSKRQKIVEGSEPAEESKDKEPDELSQEQLQQLMIIVLEEGMNIFEDMLKNFDRDDLIELWSLVHERFISTKLIEDKERELWVELKRLFKPVNDDELWKSQRYMHDPLTWRLYDTCGVHHVATEREHDIFMLVEKDYALTRGLMTLMLCNKLQVDQHSEMADELLRKIFILVNRPRQ
ncbi:hypothetical protein Tco_0058347 [Tanacetum coccineum]